MDTFVSAFLDGLQLGEQQSFKNMDVIPLFGAGAGGPDYVTLGEAIEKKLITIAEVDEGGSVPDLKVINASDSQVLLLDGEEVAGAKQNRVLNTSILVGRRSETKIPVSCTEHGRWRYTSASFKESGTVLSHRTRSGSSHAVSSSLIMEGSYRSDQHYVWSRIARLHRSTGTTPTTHAMSDVYSAKSAELDEFLNVFQFRPGQQGILVAINHEVVGFDALSRCPAYERVHAKLVKSFALDALVEEGEGEAGPIGPEAKEFLKRVRACEEKAFPSVGQGQDYRFTGKDVVGSALVVDESVVHAAFFSFEEGKVAG